MPREKEFTNRNGLTVLLDEPELSALAEAAEREGASMSKVVRGMIQRYLARRKAKPPTDA